MLSRVQLVDAESLILSNSTNASNIQCELVTVIDANVLIHSSKVSSSLSSTPITTNNDEDNHEILLLPHNASSVDNNATSIVDSATLLSTQKDCHQLTEAEEQDNDQVAIIDELSNSDYEYAALISDTILIFTVLLSLF